MPDNQILQERKEMDARYQWGPYAYVSGRCCLGGGTGHVG